MKKSIPTFREQESEAIILGNSWEQEREFPLTPDTVQIFFINANYNLIPKTYFPFFFE